MEDDDEFGDLYTDVLRPFTTSSAPQPPPIQSTTAAPPVNRPINISTHSDDEEIILGAPNSNDPKLKNYQRNQTLALEPQKGQEPDLTAGGTSDSRRNLNEEADKEESLAGATNNWGGSDSPAARVLDSGGEVKMQETGFEDPSFMDETGIDVVVDEGDYKDDILVGKDETLIERSENIQNFGMEDVDTRIGDIGSEPMIPGLSIPGVSDAAGNRGDANFGMRDEGSGEGDDWDSDSEDDLQIVLNDNHHGRMAMDRTGVVGAEDDEDEDGDPLVIVADNDPNHQPTEEQDWGDDVAQSADGERKDMGDAAKANGGVAVAPKIGYSSHGYHPFHSQFKYVRPGATPMPGAAPLGPGGAPGQVRPPVNMAIAARGRGDWRPTGIKNAPGMQKNFHPGYGMPVWGNNAPGRGFGSGLEFTLPSHKTIFEVDIDSFEEKPWRLPAIDVTDFFNFGLNEESWKEYCKQLEQLRLEATMQSKIRVYESGRTEQEYDPDLPPELAAAAGIHDISSENANLGKTEPGQSDLAKGSARVRPPLPTGRAIQVESGYGERLPSIDTRPPRIRDSDAIIEIVLQDSVDDDFYPGNDPSARPDNDLSREDLKGGDETEQDIPQKETEHSDGFLHDYNGRKRELGGRKAGLMNSVQDNIVEGDGILAVPSEAPGQYRPDSRGQTPVHPGRNFGRPHEDRRRKGRAHDRSPNDTPSGSPHDKRYLNNQKEESAESVDGKNSPLSSSPLTVGTAGVKVVEDKDATHDELVLADGSPQMAGEEMALNTTAANDTLKDEDLMHSLEKQKLSSRVEQTSHQEIDDAEDSKAARSSDNSKARSGSSKDFRTSRDGAEEEVVQDVRFTHVGNIKRPLGDDEHSVQRRSRDERQEMERNRMAIKGREDFYSHKNCDTNSAHSLHVKTEGIDRRKESERADGPWQRRDEDPHGRRNRPEDTRKRDRGDEMGPRHRSKVRENERSDKDEHHPLRKPLDNGSWRGHQEKDMGSRPRGRVDSLKSRNENMDDLHSKRRREEAQLRRDNTEKEEILHAHRENSSRRKRERDDVLDQRKRDDQARIRDDDQHSARHKEEGWFQREQGERQREWDEWHRLKQSDEESLSKRERQEARGGVRSGRAAEDKAWIGPSRVKDEYKGSERDYHLKDTRRHSEKLKRRDRVGNESLLRHRRHEDVYARGNQLSNDERRARHERASSRSDRASAINMSDNHRVHDRKQKENTRKSKESDVGDHNFLAPSKSNQEDKTSETVSLKGTIDQGGGKNEIPMNRQSSRKHREDASSDDEQQGSRRGRSKLERWTSHKERDFSIGTKSSSSLKVKEIDTYNSGSSLASKLPDECSKTVETVEIQHPSSNEKDVDDPMNKNVDVKPMEDKHLDTVAKLKKRSERFKLPMPIEKEAMAIKKMESEPLPSVQSETCADSKVKQERPARKRRWISS